VKVRIVVDRRREVWKFVVTASLIARERLLERSDLVRTDPMLFLEPVEDRARLRAAKAQQPKQVAILLRVVEALGERIDVVDHRAECFEIRLRGVFADFTNHMQHAVENRGKRAVLVLDDAQSLYLPSPSARLGARMHRKGICDPTA